MAHGVSIIHDRIEFTRRIRAYAIRVATLHLLLAPQQDETEFTDLLPHLPHALHTAEQVAAPQQLAANVRAWQSQLEAVPRGSGDVPSPC
jgi:hypothetical protein